MRDFIVLTVMGAMLLTAGTKGKRFALPNSRIMIHQPLAGMQGTAVELEIHAKEVLYLKRKRPCRNWCRMVVRRCHLRPHNCGVGLARRCRLCRRCGRPRATNSCRCDESSSKRRYSFSATA